MRGLGIVGDVVVLGLSVLSIFGWMYLWYLCVFGAEKVLAKIFGNHALTIAAVGFPFTAALVFGLALKVFGRHHMGWALALFGVCLPVLGILYLRNEAGIRKR